MTVEVIKTRKGVPSVILFEGRRYVLDMTAEGTKKTKTYLEKKGANK